MVLPVTLLDFSHEKKETLQVQKEETKGTSPHDDVAPLTLPIFHGGGKKAKATWRHKWRSALLAHLSEPPVFITSYSIVFADLEFRHKCIQHFWTHGQPPDGVSPQKMFALLARHLWPVQKKETTFLVLLHLLHDVGLSFKSVCAWHLTWVCNSETQRRQLMTPLLWLLHNYDQHAFLRVLLRPEFKEKLDIIISPRSTTMPIGIFQSCNEHVQKQLIALAAGATFASWCADHCQNAENFCSSRCSVLEYCVDRGKPALVKEILERANCDGDGVNLHQRCLDKNALLFENVTASDSQTTECFELIIAKHDDIHRYHRELKENLPFLLTNFCFMSKVGHVVNAVYHYLRNDKYDTCSWDQSGIVAERVKRVEGLD